MAWAQSSEVKVTDLNDLSNEKVYFIESQRAFLMYNTTANATGISSSNSNVVTPARELKNYKNWFSIRTIDGNRYLYSIGAGKYITKTGGFSDAPVDVLGINPATNQNNVDNTNYNWMLTIGGNGLNSQDPNQHNSGILVDSWTHNDKGNCYRIIDVESVLPFELCSSYDEITNWYKLGIRDDSQGPSYLKYDASKEYIPTTNYDENNKEAFAWAFVVTPGAGISIVNKAAGAAKVLSAPVAPTGDINSDQLARMVEKASASGNIAWDIIIPTTHGSTKEFSFYVQHPTANGYAFNRQNYNSERVLCYWTGRDTGSSIWTEDIQGDAVILKALVSELNALFTSKPKGDAVGQYSSSYENYESEFDRISGYASTLADNAIDADIRANIAILNAIKESYSINKPEAGKYYTFSNNDKYITGNVSNDRIACGANNDAYAIYYFDGSRLKSYTNGLYIGLNNTDWTFSENGSAIEFAAAVNGAAGKFNIKSGSGNNGRWLHLTVNGDGTAYVNRCSNNTCGDAHNWVVEEVAQLPVAKIGDVYYYVLTEAAEAAEAGDTVELLAATDDTVRFGIGVTIDKNGFTADNVTVATPVAEVGGVEYATLAAAIKAATAGGTITFVADINESDTLSKNVTIDGANFKYTGTMTLTAGITVAVKNLNFVNALVVENDRKSTGTYTFTNCNFDGENQTSPIYALSIRQAKSVVVDNCTIKNYSNGGIYLRSSVTNLTVKDVTFENIRGYGAYFASGVTAGFESVVFKNVVKGIQFNNSSARSLTIKNCKMEDVTTAINHTGGTLAITANVQGANDFGGATLSQYANCVLAENATLAATTAGLNITTNDEGKEVAYKGGVYSVVEASKAYTDAITASNAEVTATGDNEVTVKYTGDVKFVDNANGVGSNWISFIITKPAKVDATKAMVKIPSGSDYKEVTLASVLDAGKDYATMWTSCQFKKAFQYEIDWNGDETCDLIVKIDATEATPQVPVAKVGKTYYSDFAEAIAAAEADETQTITLLKDATIATTINGAGLTIEGEGHTLTYTGSGASARAITVESTANGANLTVKNLTIDCTASYCQRGINYNTNGKLTLESVTVKGTNVTYALNLPGSSDNATVAINNSSLTGNIALNVWGENSTITAENSVFTSVDNSTAENYAAVVLNNDGSTVANGTTVTINGGSITAKDENGNLSNAVRNSTSTGVVNVSENTVVIGNYTKPVAIVTYGTDQFYSCATLQDAIDKAIETKGTVELIADVEASEIITVNGSVVIDGKDKTLKSIAKRAINVSGADGVTIKNLTINASGERAINVIQGATNVTIENVTATAANYTVNIAASAPNAVVAIKNSTLNGLCTVNVSAEGAQVTVDDSTVNCNDNNTTAGESYAALCLNKEAVGGSIVATNTTVNVAEGSDSQKGRNGAEDGSVTINGSTDGVTVMVAAITYPGSDYYHSFATLASAVEFAKAGDVITLIRDVTASEIITIDKAITLDGKGKTLTSTATRAINIETEGEVVINNLTVNAGERAFNIINEPAKVVLNGVTAVANNNAVMIATSAGAANVTIDGCNFTGLAVVNVAGAKSNVAIKDSKITNVDANPEENYGAITVWTSAEEAVVNVVDTEITAAEDSKKAYVFPANATVNGVDEVGRIIVTVGDAGYDTLAEAVEKANGETIKFVMSVEGPGVVINKNAVIDFNGCTYTFNGGAVGSSNTKSNGFQIIAGNTVTLKNGALNVAEDAKGEFYMLIQNYADLTVEGMNLDGTNLDKYSATDGDSYVLSNNCGAVNVIASTITANNDGDKAFALDACKYANYDAPVVTVAEGSTINGNVEVSATLNMNGALNGAIVINGVNGVVNGAEGLNVTANVADYKLAYADGKYTVVEKNYVAQAGEAKFETLAEAVAAGSEVTLLKDVTGAGVVINKDVTIDFGGFTYTVNEGVGSKGTETLGLQILKENNVTLKNGTLTSEGENIKMLINNYANLTVDNMQLVDATDYIQYVLSNNCGEVAIIGSEITADGAIALDACEYANYALPTVTVEEGSTINGNVEVSATLNMNGTLNGAIVLNGANGVVNGAEGLDITTTVADHKVVRGEDGAYTVVAKHYVAKIGEQGYESFAEAVAAAKDGDTITLLEDVATSLTIAKSVTVDGDDHTFTGMITANGKGKYVTMKNINFNGNEKAIQYAVRSDNGNLIAFENCTAVDYLYGMLYANKNNNNITMKNVVVENCGICANIVYFNNATFENVTVKNSDNGVQIQNYGKHNVTFTDCTMENVETPINVLEKGTAKVNFTFNGENNFGAAFNLGNYATTNAVAMGGTKLYATLHEAVEASDNVTLVTNITAAGLVIDKDLTIDFNGCTYTVNKAVGSKGTETLGLQILKNHNVTLKNGTLKSTAVTEGKEVKMLVQNYANLTVENMNLVDATEHIQYVLSNNSGDNKITGATNITTDAVAFDAYKSNSYAAPTVTVETTGTIAGTIEKNEGATIVINNGTYTMDVTEWCAESYICQANEDGTFGVVFDPAYGKSAKIDNAYYTTFAEAVAAAKDGDTITLLEDVATSLTIAKSVTVDGDGHTFTGMITANGKGKYVTMKNINFNGNEKAIQYAVRSDNGNLIAFENCTAVDYLYGMLYANKNNNNITMKNVVVENCGICANIVYFNNATFENVTVKNSDNGVQIQNYGKHNVTFTDCTMENVETPINVLEKGTAKVNFTFKGENDFGAVFSLGKYAVVNGNVLGGTKIYASLAEAVAASNDIRLFANTTGAGAVINKSLTFDLCGYAYSFTEGVGSTGTESNGLQILKNNDVVVKNGSMNVAAAAASKFYTIIQNYANLTVEDMNLDGTNLDKWSLTDGDSYVLSNNSGNVVVKGNTNITANNDGEKAFAFDACDKSANGYALPVVTVETTGKIAGNIENSAKIVITNGTYTIDVTEWCAEGYVCLPNEDGTFGVVFDPAYGKAAKIGNVYYETFDEAYEVAEAGATIELLVTAVFTEDKTLDKNVTLKAEFGDVAIRVQDGATVDFAGTSVESNDYCVILGSSDKATAGYVNISAGTFKGETTAVSVTKGNLNITGGEFQVEPYEESYAYTINCYDASYKNGEAAVAITGGKFYNFNPADNAAEGEGTNFIPEERRDEIASGVDAEGWWTVTSAVAVIGETGYISINHAFAAAQEGDTVTMIADVELGFADAVKNNAGVPVLANVDGKNITFDMNGKKISVTHTSTNKNERIYAVICVENGAGLTVKGEGYIDVTTGITDPKVMPKVAYMFWKRGTTGYLVIENGNFHMDNSEDSMVYTNGDQIVTVKGGTFTLDAVRLRGEEKDYFPWIFNADGRNDRSIVVTGGTYNCEINKQFYDKEVLIPEEVFVHDNKNGTWTVMGAAAKIGDVYYETFAKAYKDAVEGDVIELTRTAVVTKDTILNKNVTVKAEFGDVAIRVQDGATVDFAGTSVESNDYCVILGSSDKATAGYVNISAGTFKGETTAVSVTKGNLNITGGEFQVEPYEGSYVYTINCYDASYKNGDATVAITGGKFYNFNPADNAAEGEGTNFIPVDRRGEIASGVDAENWWTVSGAVAEVAGNVYISLVDAVAAAGNNDVVTLLQNVTGAGVVINKSITIDFNGKTYTANVGVGSKGTETLGLQILKENTVTLKNGTLTSEGENIKMLINNYANLTVENMNLVDATDAIQYVLSNNCGEVAINNSVITSDAVALDACKYASYDAPVVTVDANSVVTGNVEVSATLNMEGRLNGAIVINGKAGVVNAAEGLTVTTNIADYKVVYADGAYTVIEKDYIAQVGDVKYEYIDEAVAAGKYVTILKDFTAAGLVIDKDLTIDFAGHTYTFNEAVGKYNGLLINKGNKVTLKNGTLNVAPEAANKFYILVQNYADSLTVKDMNLDGTNLDMWALTDGDSYVLTSNSGNVVIKGETNITANNDGALAFAFNAYDKTAEGYSATKVTVETTGFINGKIEKTGTNPSIVIKSGRYIFNVTKWCADGVAAVEQTDGTWLVTSVVAKVQNNDGIYGFATLQAAVAAADEGATITLMANVTLDEVIKVEKKLTFELGSKTITANCQKAFEIYADATFNRGTINAVNRCIDVCKSVNLKLYYITLNANGYSDEYLEPQALTIGGDGNGTTKVAIDESTIRAKEGYAIVSFVKTELSSSYLTVEGLGALYVKGGSAGSVFDFGYRTTLTGDCRYNDVPENAFSTIAIQENNVTVKTNSYATVNVYGNNMSAIGIASEYTGNVVEINGNSIYFNGNGNILNVDNADANKITLRSTYADKVLEEGYSYTKSGSSYIVVKKLVVLDTLLLDDTMDEYVQNEVVLNVKKLTYKRTFQQKHLNVWQALYVPFEIPVSMLNDLGYDVAYYNDFRETVVDLEITGKMFAEIVRIKGGTLKANFPYLIMPKTNDALEMNLELEDVTLYSTSDTERMHTIECTSAIKKFEFFGTYKKSHRAQLTGDATDNTACYAVNNSGNLQAIPGGDYKLGAFRIYLIITNKDGSVYIPSEAQMTIGVRVVGEENEDGTTTIYDVPEEAETEDMIFDLNGRRVLETEKGGIYIINGKKVYVK